MNNLEKQLKEITLLRKEQDKVILLRTEVPQLYTKLLDKEANINFKKMTNPKICLNDDKINTIIIKNDINVNDLQIKPKISFEEIFEEMDKTVKCLSYLQSNEKLWNGT